MDRPDVNARRQRGAEVLLTVKDDPLSPVNSFTSRVQMSGVTGRLFNQVREYESQIRRTVSPRASLRLPDSDALSGFEPELVAVFYIKGVIELIDVAHDLIASKLIG